MQIVEQLLLRHDSISVQTLNIATWNAHSILEILEYIKNTLDITFQVEYSSRDKNNFDLCFDNGKLSSLLPSFELNRFDPMFGVCMFAVCFMVCKSSFV